MDVPLFLFFLITTALRCSAAATGGFGVKIHRHPDSPFSPSYRTLNVSDEDRMAAIDERSTSRYNYLLSKLTTNISIQDDINSPLKPGPSNSWEYLMTFAIGTPPIDVTARVDTGSGLSWIQCLPCELCYEQDVPTFDPSKSSSFRKLPCEDLSCNEDIPEKSCSSNCNYMIVYPDRSWSKGDVASERFIFPTGRSGNENRTLDEVLFGCGHSNRGFNHQEQGLVGLDMSSSSLVMQVPDVTGFKFSFCLVPYHNPGSSELLFGDRADMSGLSTPLVTEFEDSLYFINLDDIDVGSERLDIPPGTFHRTGRPTSKQGGMIVDSGTTMTHLIDIGYQKLISKLKEKITLPIVEDPNTLCYKGTLKDLVEKNIPRITFHFSGGLDFVWPPWYSFYDATASMVCLAVRNAKFSRFSILGNLAMQDKNVGINIGEEKVYITRRDCANFAP